MPLSVPKTLQLRRSTWNNPRTPGNPAFAKLLDSPFDASPDTEMPAGLTPTDMAVFGAALSGVVVSVAAGRLFREMPHAASKAFACGAMDAVRADWDAPEMPDAPECLTTEAVAECVAHAFPYLCVQDCAEEDCGNKLRGFRGRCDACFAILSENREPIARAMHALHATVVRACGIEGVDQAAAAELMGGPDTATAWAVAAAALDLPPIIAALLRERGEAEARLRANLPPPIADFMRVYNPVAPARATWLRRARRVAADSGNTNATPLQLVDAMQGEIKVVESFLRVQGFGSASAQPFRFLRSLKQEILEHSGANTARAVQWEAFLAAALSCMPQATVTDLVGKEEEEEDAGGGGCTGCGVAVALATAATTTGDVPMLGTVIGWAAPCCAYAARKHVRDRGLIRAMDAKGLLPHSVCHPNARLLGRRSEPCCVGLREVTCALGIRLALRPRVHSKCHGWRWDPKALTVVQSQSGKGARELREWKQSVRAANACVRKFEADVASTVRTGWRAPCVQRVTLHEVRVPLGAAWALSEGEVPKLEDVARLAFLASGDAKFAACVPSANASWLMDVAATLNASDGVPWTVVVGCKCGEEAREKLENFRDARLVPRRLSRVCVLFLYID